MRGWQSYCQAQKKSGSQEARRNCSICTQANSCSNENWNHTSSTSRESHEEPGRAGGPPTMIQLLHRPPGTQQAFPLAVTWVEEPLLPEGVVALLQHCRSPSYCSPL